jgi:hypothetical protein
MTWWLRTHRVIWLATACVIGSLASSLFGAASFLFPSLEGGSPFGSVPLFAVLPLAIIITLSTFLAEADQPIYRSVARARLRYDWTLSIGVIAVTAVVSLPLLAVTSHGPVETVRNVIGFVGLQWVLAPVLSYRYQAAAPVLYVFISAVFGRAAGAQGTVGAWAWPLAPSSEASFWILPSLLGVVGSAMALTRGPAALRSV